MQVLSLWTDGHTSISENLVHRVSRPFANSIGTECCLGMTLIGGQLEAVRLRRACRVTLPCTLFYVSFQRRDISIYNGSLVTTIATRGRFKNSLSSPTPLERMLEHKSATSPQKQCSLISKLPAGLYLEARKLQPLLGSVSVRARRNL